MRVLVLNTLYPPYLVGGAERSVAELARDLAARGAEVTVLSLRPGGPAADTMIDGVRAIAIPLRNIYWPYRGARRPRLQRAAWQALDLYNPPMRGAVAAAIEAARPDVVHTNNLQGFSVAAWHAAARAGVPVVHTLRDHYLICARSSRFRAGAPCARTCLRCVPFLAARRRASASVAAVAGVSRHILDLHRGLGLFPAARHERVIHRCPAPVTAPREAIPAGRPLRLGYLGRIDALKGVEQLIRAVRGDARFELVVGGEGEPAYVDGVRRLAGGSARFLGAVDAPAFLAGLDALVVPSLWHEPLARVLLEGLAAGVPIVASRRGGNPELVDDGVTGALYEPSIPGALERALARLAAEPGLIPRMSRAALDRARALSTAPLGVAYLELFAAVAT